MHQASFFDGLEERNRILDSMRANHPVYLTAIQSFAREIIYRKGECSIDDVREMIEAKGFPMPDEIGADNRIFGSVFRSKEFIPIRQQPTRRAERIARAGRGSSYVTIYTMKGAA